MLLKSLLRLYTQYLSTPSDSPYVQIILLILLSLLLHAPFLSHVSLFHPRYPNHILVLLTQPSD